MKSIFQVAGRKSARIPLLFSLLLGIQQSAFAQNSPFGQLNSSLSSIVTLLQGAGVLVVTVAVMWAGYKMIFQHARWADVATIVLGAILIGGASAIAGFLIPAS
jgi:type IV secretion system protein VirB2